jgi:flagellar protein FliL
MSETVEAISGDEKAPKKGKGKLLMIIGLVVVLAGGGGGGYFYWSKAKAAAAEEDGEETTKSESQKSKKAKKVADGDEEESSAKSGSMKSGLPSDENVKEVVELAPFIVNLSDDESPRYLRLSVSVGLGEGKGGEEKPSPLFMTRVKNAMLVVLAGKTSEEILSVEGKTKLRKELLKAAQAASEEPHVEAIYITDFIVQL